VPTRPTFTTCCSCQGVTASTGISCGTAPGLHLSSAASPRPNASPRIDELRAGPSRSTCRHWSARAKRPRRSRERSGSVRTRARTARVRLRTLDRKKLNCWRRSRVARRADARARFVFPRANRSRDAIGCGRRWSESRQARNRTIIVVSHADPIKAAVTYARRATGPLPANGDLHVLDQRHRIHETGTPSC